MSIFLQGYKIILALALILLIDTCFDKAYVALLSNDRVIEVLENFVQKNHASFVHVATKQLLENAGYTFKQIDAIAVNAGPGSYTGIRVGLAAAKGFCFAAGKPLIVLNTLEVLAVAGFTSINNLEDKEEYTCCAVLTARVNEVYIALYDFEMNIIKPPQVLVLNDDNSVSKFFNDVNAVNKIIFSGDGYSKIVSIQQKNNMLEGPVNYSLYDLAATTNKKFSSASLNISTIEPFYLKPFYTK